MKLDWTELLSEEFRKDYYLKIDKFLNEQTVDIYPNREDIFNIYNLCSLNKLKILILGQDPYHTPNTAHGLAFSSIGQKRPPSLQNIFIEIYSDLEIKKSFDEYFTTNNLTYWAKQGVFLLNTCLTVEKGKAGSHSNLGWQNFTRKTIQIINNKEEPIVIMLWGNYAKKFRELLTNPKHLILEAAHPSPFSAYNGFMGCKHFSKSNNFLKKNYDKIIDWSTK
jgi:uracil-DNA glycosylase